MKQERKYGIDLLRIIMMFFIVMGHVIAHFGVINGEFNSAMDKWVVQTILFAILCHVDCFALISGYVGINSKYKYSNIIYLWLIVLIYNVLLTFVAKILFPADVSRYDLIQAFFPIFKGGYWYFSAYIGLFFFMPLLNMGINSLNERQAKISFGIIFFLFSCMYFLTNSRTSIGILEGYNTIWLMVLYIFGALIRKYNLFDISVKTSTFGYLGCTGAYVVAELFIDKMLDIGINNNYVHTYFSDISARIPSYINPLTVLQAIFLLKMFEKIQINGRVKKVIMHISPLVFSVYILHTNEHFWNYIEDTLMWVAKNNLIVVVCIIFGVSMGIFSVCLLIDSIREKIFRVLKVKEHLVKMELKLINNVWENNL